MTDSPRKRRRAVRPSDASDIDRSWDSPEAIQIFSEPADAKDARHSDDYVVILDDAEEADDQSADFDEEFWKEQRPPHSG